MCLCVEARGQAEVSIKTWVQSPSLTWWKERINSWKFVFNFHAYIMVRTSSSIHLHHHHHHPHHYYHHHHHGWNMPQRAIFYLSMSPSLVFMISILIVLYHCCYSQFGMWGRATKQGERSHKGHRWVQVFELRKCRFVRSNLYFYVCIAITLLTEPSSQASSFRVSVWGRAVRSPFFSRGTGYARW